MGNTYVMSDIHGMAELLKKMLEKIGFTAEDKLFILGDMIDRGPDPAGVLELVMQNENITALKGNHEDCFVEWYENVSYKECERYYYNTYDVLMDDPATAERLPEYVAFMKRLPLYAKTKVRGIRCLMAHASTWDILRLVKNKDRLIWDSSMTNEGKGVPGCISVVGHVPTFTLRGYPKEPAKIWRSPDGSLIDVDCGAAFAGFGGRLGCLCLETDEEFYVQ